MADYFDYRFGLVDYSDKCFVLLLEFEGGLTSWLKTIGGKFNSRLACGPGWVFSKAKHTEEVLDLLKYCEAPERWLELTDVQEAAKAAGAIRTSRRTENNNKDTGCKGSNSMPTPDYILTDAERRNYWQRQYPDFAESFRQYMYKKYPVIVRLAGGECLPIESRGLKTEFWFGESDFGQGLTPDEAAASAKAAKSEEYFLEENLSDLKEFIACLEDPEKYARTSIEANCHLWLANWCDEPDRNEWTLSWSRVNPAWENARNDIIAFCDLRTADLYDAGKYRPLTDDDRKRILTGYRLVLEKREKRCRMWLKRYGVEKIKSSTYWADR